MKSSNKAADLLFKTFHKKLFLALMYRWTLTPPEHVSDPQFLLFAF